MFCCISTYSPRAIHINGLIMKVNTSFIALKDVPGALNLDHRESYVCLNLEPAGRMSQPICYILDVFQLAFIPECFYHRYEEQDSYDTKFSMTLSITLLVCSLGLLSLLFSIQKIPQSCTSVRTTSAVNSNPVLLFPQIGMLTATCSTFRTNFICLLHI